MNLFYDKTKFILGYVCLIIGVVGVIGSVLVIIVFSRRSLRKYSYSFYCKIMAISDMGFLSYAFIDWAANNLGASLLTVGPLSCQIVQFIPYAFANFSTHLLTVISIDRMITIVYPKQFLVVKKRWFQCLIVAIVAVIVLATNILIPLNYRLIEIYPFNLSQPIRLCLISTQTQTIQMWIILPCFIIVNIIFNNLMNIKTIRFIMASRRRVAANGRNISLARRDKKFSICSLCLNLAAIFFKMPFFLSVIIIGYSNKTVDEIGLIMKITGMITYFESGFSFFINMLVNSLFYKEFLRLFGFSKSNSIETSNSINNNNNSNTNNGLKQNSNKINNSI